MTIHPFAPGDQVRIMSTRYQGQLGTVMERNPHGARPEYTRVKVDGTVGSAIWFPNALLSKDTSIKKIDLGRCSIYRFGVGREWCLETHQTGHIRPLMGGRHNSAEVALADALETALIQLEELSTHKIVAQSELIVGASEVQDEHFLENAEKNFGVSHE